MGTIGCFSFYANKILTTGEGGMVVTDDDALAERARRLKDLAHAPGRRFLHTELAYNYRMTNVQAAIGLAQVEEIDRFIALKQKMADGLRPPAGRHPRPDPAGGESPGPGASTGCTPSSSRTSSE